MFGLFHNKSSNTLNALNAIPQSTTYYSNGINRNYDNFIPYLGQNNIRYANMLNHDSYRVIDIYGLDNNGFDKLLKSLEYNIVNKYDRIIYKKLDIKSNYDSNKLDCVNTNDDSTNNDIRTKLKNEFCRNKMITLKYDPLIDDLINDLSYKYDFKYKIYNKPKLIISDYDHVNLNVDHNLLHLDLLTNHGLMSNGIFKKPKINNCCKYGLCRNNEQECIYIFVMDTGISKVFDQLSNNVDRRFEMPPDHDDTIGHGTFCASLINSISYGVDPNAVIVPIKLLESEFTTDVNHIKKIFRYMKTLGKIPDSPCRKDHKCIINMSFIDADRSNISILKDLLTELHETESYIMFSSAGNQNDDSCLYSPGNHPNVINIGSVTYPIEINKTNTNDKSHLIKRSKFSNWGECVDFWFYGENIKGLSHKYGKLMSMSGTSMTNPIASAITSIYLANNPNPESNIDNIINHLRSTSKKCVIKNINPVTSENNGKNYLLGLDPQFTDHENKYINSKIKNCKLTI